MKEKMDLIVKLLTEVNQDIEKLRKTSHDEDIQRVLISMMYSEADNGKLLENAKVLQDYVNKLSVHLNKK